MSPNARISAATARPDSARKIGPMSVAPDIGERPHSIGAPNGSVTRAAQRERGVEVGGLEEVEAAEVLARLHERPVGGQHLAVLDTRTTVAVSG